MPSYQPSGGAIIAPTCVHEVPMLGRRSHARLSVESGGEGVLSLSRDVSVRVTSHGEIVAICREAGAIGESVRIVLPDEQVDFTAEVIESKPVMTDGAVRHRLLLRLVGSDSEWRR